jgi:hypothetical protein
MDGCYNKCLGLAKNHKLFQHIIYFIGFSASHVATFSSSYEMIIVMNFWSMMMEIRWMILYCMEKWASSALIMLRYQMGAAAMYGAGNSMAA